VVLPIIRAGGTSGTITVNWSTSNGSANFLGDYNPNSGTLVLGPGELAKLIEIQTLPDSEEEITETFK